ncbi:signal peptidase I [Thermococcus sp.]|uniref:signal peptidase I n=1 Tax=Thermococcus sp. TaxID=35749 RepID=UPI002610004C|nr:signal peptidase I [Thermococcus sp.]
MKRIENVVFSFLTYFFLAFVIIVVVLHFVFGFQYVVILTNSMQPTINPGDLVVVKPVDPYKLHVGDIILYQIHIGGATYRITHRIVAIGHDREGRLYFITKGDNRKYTDPWRVYPNQVIGEVVLVIPHIGKVWYYTPLIVLIIFLFIIGSLAYDLALELLEPYPLLSKARKPELLRMRRKKAKVHHYRKRKEV